MQYLTYWENLVRPSWEPEENLHQYGNHVVVYWAGKVVLNWGGNAKFRRYRVQVAKRATARVKGERRVLSGFEICCDDRGTQGLFSAGIVGSYVYCDTTNTGWQRGQEWWVGGRCGEQDPAAYDQDSGPGETVQRAPAQGNAENRRRPARSVVLARTRADEEREALRIILGVVGNGGERTERHDFRPVNRGIGGCNDKEPVDQRGGWWWLQSNTVILQTNRGIES